MILMPLKVIDFLVEAFNRVLVITICIFMFIAVVLRYFLAQYSLAWAEEAGRSLLIYLTFFGCATALKRNVHFSVPVLVRRLPHRWQRYMSLLGIAGVLVFSLIMAWLAWPWALGSVNEVLPTTRISYFWVYVTVPAGATLLVGYSILLLVRQLRMAEVLELGHGVEEAIPE